MLSTMDFLCNILQLQYNCLNRSKKLSQFKEEICFERGNAILRSSASTTVECEECRISQ